MNTKTAGFLIMVGLLVTFGGVGGIETSETDADMLSACIVSIVGLMVMYCGTLGLKGSAYYD